MTTDGITAVNRARYSARDFDTLFDDMKQYLEDRYPTEFTDFQSTTQGVMLMDMLAHSLSQLHWYIDRRASEAYLDTARRTKSASRLTRQQGYRMRPSASSSVELSVSPEAAQLFEFPVKQGFKFTGPEGLIFEATETVTWAAGDTSTKTVSVREGTTLRVTSASDGTASQEVRLPAADNDGNFLLNSSVVVYVDGVLWEEADFLDFGENNQFEVHYHEEPALIRFGNAISGKIPDIGSDIRISYVVQHGEGGNVGNGTIVDVDTSLVYRFTTIALTITNADASSGGADPETIEEARRNAPRFFGSRKRAVTQEDYQVLAGVFTSPEYGAIAAANAFVARTVEEDLEAQGYITTVKGEIETYQVVLASDVTAGEASAASAVVSTTTLALRSSEVATQTAAIIASAATLATQANELGAQSPQMQAVVDLFAIMLANDGTWAYDIDELITATSSLAPVSADLTNNWKPAITLMDSINTAVKAVLDANAPGLRTGAVNIDSYADLADSALADIDTENAAIIVIVGTDLPATLTSIGSIVATHEVTIDATLDLLEAHLTDILGADCKTNVITVPVLSFDGDGNYQAPSQALRNELERYLQGIADVAHVVNVVSGVADIVVVDISVNLKQADSFVFSEVSSDTNSVIVTEMKKREFSASLYLNKAYKLVEDVTGVEDFDLTLSADATYVDSAGNIICPESKVLTLGTLTILPLVT